MPMNRCCLVSLLTLVTFTSWASEPLSFQQCVDLVKRNNANIQALEETARAKGFQVQSVRGAYFPQVSANLSYQQTGPAGTLTQTVLTSNSAMLSATQNIFNGFSDVGKMTQAEQDSLSSLAALQTAKAAASYDLKVTLGGLLYSKETEKLSQDFIKRREDNLRMVELRYQNGRENKGSLLLSRAYLAQARVDLMKAQNVHQISLSDFRKVVGIDDEQEVQVSEEIPLTDPPEAGVDFKKIVLDLPQRQQLVAQMKSADAAKEVARSAFFPTLSLSGSVGKVDDHFFPEKDRWTVGANLSWSLFGGGKDYYATQVAVANFSSAQKALTHLERDQISTLKKAYVGFVEAVADLKVSEAFLAAAKSRAEIARAKYNNGLLNFDEWDIIENDLINKSKSYLLARRQRVIAEAAWEQARGVGVIP